jgi:hypothetical protein
MPEDTDEWWQQLMRTVDRALGRVYATDPLLYAELVKIRRRLEPRSMATTNGTPASRGGRGSRLVRRHEC